MPRVKNGVARHARGVIPRVVGPIEGGRALRQIEGPLRGPARVLDVAGVARRHAEFRPRLRELGVELASALEEGDRALVAAGGADLVAHGIRAKRVNRLRERVHGRHVVLLERVGRLAQRFPEFGGGVADLGDDVFLLRR